MADEEKLIGAFEKNSRGEQVRLYLGDYMGRPTIDLRVWVEGDDGQWVRTKKGITMSVDLYPQLRSLVDGLEAHL